MFQLYGVPWAELKIDKHLRTDCQQNTDIWCHFTYNLQFWIMTGIFYSGAHSIFQYQTICKSNVELGLVYKTFINIHTCETPLLPRKMNCIHCSRNAGFFGKLNKVIFPLQPKTHLFGEILLEQVACRLPNEEHWWACSCSCFGRCVCGHALPGEMPIQGVPPFVMLWWDVIENRVYLAHKYSVICLNRFLAMFRHTPPPPPPI